MRTPLGIAISDSNRMYVASQNTGSVEVYQLEIPIPDIAISPDSHDFGEVHAGTSESVTFIVTNEGVGDLLIGAVTSPALPFNILADTCANQTIAPSSTCTIDISFEPTEMNTYAGNFTISSNDPDEGLLSVSLTGTGLTALPVADAGGPYAGTEGQSISLNGSGSSDSDGTIVSYEWDFGDDSPLEYGQSVSHTYNQGGIFTVTLTVTDNEGASDVDTTTADISDTSPMADFTCSPTNGIVPLTVNCADSSAGYDQPLSYAWDFDNNGTVDSTEQNPTYVYTETGTYTVKLTVTDSDGSSSTLTRTNYITVSAEACANQPVNIEGTSAYYATLQEACNEALDGDTILSRSVTLVEDLTFDQNISVVFRGGYDCDFVNKTGVTGLQGNITINSGTLSIEDIVIE
jgi:PKD repeat protein